MVEGFELFLTGITFQKPPKPELDELGVCSRSGCERFFFLKSNYGIIRTTPKKFSEMGDTKKRSGARKSRKRIKRGKEARMNRACERGQGLSCGGLSAYFIGKIRIG